MVDPSEVASVAPPASASHADAVRALAASEPFLARANAGTVPWLQICVKVNQFWDPVELVVAGSLLDSLLHLEVALAASLLEAEVNHPDLPGSYLVGLVEAAAEVVEGHLDMQTAAVMVQFLVHHRSALEVFALVVHHRDHHVGILEVVAHMESLVEASAAYVDLADLGDCTLRDDLSYAVAEAETLVADHSTD